MTHFILSDDLTGAAGVASMVGPSRAVTVDVGDYQDKLREEFPCIVLNLDVRERGEKEAQRTAAGALALAEGSWVALRIDSALRGAIRGLVREIASRGRVLVTDTMPDYGRSTRGGKTIMGESVKDLREKLKALQVELGEDMVVVADSETPEDLEGLAKRCLAEGRIPVDPGPLVSLVVRAMLDGPQGSSGSGSAAPKRPAGRVAFVVGTTDEMTMKQLRYIEKEGYTIRRPSPREPAAVSVFSFSFDREWKYIDAPFLESLRDYDTLVLSGGTTANFLLRKSGFKCIASGDQVQPLLSTGQVRGGIFDGKQVVLKGGFIGNENTYKTILGWLNQT